MGILTSTMLGSIGVFIMQWHLRTIKSLLPAVFVLSKLLAEACYLGNLIAQVDKRNKLKQK